MAELIDPKAIVRAAVEESELEFQRALSSVPQQYHCFILPMEQSKKVGGTKQSPLYANIKRAYMAVDGRVKMFADAHQEKGDDYRIDVDFIFDEHPRARVVVESPLYGKVVAHAKIGFGGSGADSTNPLENAETSAIGRALGFFGFGLLGGGIASAEEVMSAIGERERQQSRREQATN